MRRIVFAFFLLLPLSAAAESGPLFMKDLLGGREFYEPWGVGVDFYTMDQNYEIKQLQFDLPGISLSDPSLLKVAQ